MSSVIAPAICAVTRMFWSDAGGAQWLAAAERRGRVGLRRDERRRAAAERHDDEAAEDGDDDGGHVQADVVHPRQPAGP